MSTGYRPFSVLGLELEYAVVDDALVPACLVEPLFRHLHGRPTSDVEFGNVGCSNELAAHVFEIKTVRPPRSLVAAERQLVAGVRRVSGVLGREFGARLLPTGMHPFMRPQQTALWPRAGRRIYRTYDRVFGIKGHGWLNVQAAHVNLPLGREANGVRLHTAVACLLPYLPALAASSPIVEGRVGRAVDNRLTFYRTNQRRIPLITGAVVPELVDSYREYRSRILKPIYRALDGVPGGDVLQHEWVNSRGAIVRFMRQAIEIRVLDAQECVHADVSIAAFVRGALRWMTGRLADGTMTPPDHAVLVRDYQRTVVRGGVAVVSAPHLAPGRSPRTARRVLEALVDHAESELAAAERPFLEHVRFLLRHGSLSERIAHAVRRRSPHEGARRRAVIRDLYADLADCLIANEPWRR